MVGGGIIPGMRVDVIIVNYHRETLTEATIAEVLGSEGVEPRVILVDNDSDGRWVMDRFAGHPWVVPIVNQANLGFAAACNQGIAKALHDDADFILLLNNDARPAPEALAHLAAAAHQPGLAVPKILLPDGRIWAAGGRVELARARARNRGIYQADGRVFDTPCRVDFGSGCALMIARRVLERGFRLHEPFFLYYEDADFCLRLRRVGFQVAYEPRARVTHLESASTPAERSFALAYYDVRNRLLFLRRHGRGFTRFAGFLYWLGSGMARGLAWSMRPRLRPHGHAVLRAMVHALASRTGPMP